MSVPEAVLSAMRQTNDLFHSAVVAKKDVQQLDRIYTIGARLLPPGAPMITGLAGIRAFWEQAIKAMSLQSAQLSTVETQACGDGVFEVGRADLILGDGQKATVKYVVMWKQEDGEWKWDVDIWNMNE
jgi:ketosteroid isomerase-like protein